MVRPIHRILLWGRDTGRVRQTVASLRECLPGVSVEASHGLEKAVEAADIVVTTTASTAPLIHGSWLKPGQHVTAIGADDELKLELDRAAVERFDRRFVDGADVTARYGELALHHWANAVRPEVHGELGQLISGAVKGRSHDAQITLSKHVGLGVEDVAAAVTALEKLKELAR